MTRRMTMGRWLLGATIAGMFPMSHAQAQAPRAAPPDVKVERKVIELAPGSPVIEIEKVLLEGAGTDQVVKGAPYCADAVRETAQSLLDADGSIGNRIVRQNKTRLCRDGEGRTRQEIERGGRKLVYLRDPVANESWVLDLQRKSARSLRRHADDDHAVMFRHGEQADGALWRDYAERMREWGRTMADRVRGPAPGRSASTPTMPVPPVAGAGVGEARVVTIVRREQQGGDPARNDVEVRIMRNQDAAAGGSPIAPLEPLAELRVPPGVSWVAESFAPRGAGVKTSLGSKSFDGVDAHGERTAWTIEAGKVGNEKPIVIVREVWTAPELMLTLQTRDFDPRRGETTYRLTNLKRGEPDAALMRVPADFSRGAPGR